MKQLTFILFFTLCNYCFSQKHDFKLSTQAKTDSIEVLAGYDFFCLGYEPGDLLAERVAHLVHLVTTQCSFEELEGLLKHKNPYINLYGFIGLCDYHFHRITDDHKKIMRSKLPFKMYGQEKNEKSGTIGDIAKLMYETTQEINTQDAIYGPQLEVAIKSLILKFALYPETYSPILFEYFILNDSDLKINHTYLLKNSLGNVDTAIHVFVTDRDYIIQEISLNPYENTGTILANPAKIDGWLKLYARPINKQDSLELNLVVKQWQIKQ